MTKKPSVVQVEKIRTAAMAGRRSGLYQWMNENFDVFRSALAEAGKPNWAELAKVFAEDSLWGATEKPSGERARLTWLQVRKTRERRTAKAASGSPVRCLEVPAARPAHQVEDDPDDKPNFDGFLR